MKPQAKTAITTPCFFAFETTHPRYGEKHEDHSILLTVNTGYE